jgi:DNA-binding XRE family transcriptional regulator
MTPSEIRAVRDRLGLNQTDFAQLLNVSRNTVTKWENGRSTPSLLKEDMIRQYDRQARESDDNEFIRQVGPSALCLVSCFQIPTNRETLSSRLS